MQIDPWHVPGRLLLASVFLAQGRVRGAAEQAKYAAFALPNDADMICRVAQCLVKVGEINAARACMRHPEIDRSRSGPALAALAHIYQGLGHARGIAGADGSRPRAGFRQPGLPLLPRHPAAVQRPRRRGRERTRGLPAPRSDLRARFADAGAIAHSGTVDDNHLEFIRHRLEAVEPGTEDHAGFEFAQYKELEDLGSLRRRLGRAATRQCRDARAPEDTRLQDEAGPVRRGHHAAATGNSPARPRTGSTGRCRSSSSACRAPARHCSSASSAIIRR